MPHSLRQEFTHIVGDRLRGLRYVVKALGSDAERPKFAPPALPEALPEIDNFMGLAFRAVGGVMGAAETVVMPLRKTRSLFNGFSGLEQYFAEEGELSFCDDVYLCLKTVSLQKGGNQLLLKGPLQEVYREMKARITSEMSMETLCAVFFFALLSADPMAGRQQDEIRTIRQYLTVTLLFGLSLTGRIPREEVSLVVHDAFLLAKTRSPAIMDIVKRGSEKDLAVSLAKLLRQLA
jgi:hypothetical protein